MKVDKSIIATYRIYGLKKDLNKLGLLPAELARAIGISRSHMSRILSSEKKVSEKLFYKINRILERQNALGNR